MCRQPRFLDAAGGPALSDASMLDTYRHASSSSAAPRFGPIESWSTVGLSQSSTNRFGCGAARADRFSTVRREKTWPRTSARLSLRRPFRNCRNDSSRTHYEGLKGQNGSSDQLTADETRVHPGTQQLYVATIAESGRPMCSIASAPKGSGRCSMPIRSRLPTIAVTGSTSALQT